MSIRYIGYKIHADKIIPCEGRIHDLKKDPTICELTRYSSDGCHGRWDSGSDNRSITVWIKRRDALTGNMLDMLHNPHGPAYIHISLDPGTPENPDNYRSWSLEGIPFDIPTKFVKIEHKKRELYVALGFNVIGKYLVQEQTNVESNVPRV